MITKRKTRRFDDGGDVDAANATDDPIAALNASSGWTDTDEATPVPTPAKPQSFKEAFASARSDGDKVFTWNGKSYTTQLASDNKPVGNAGRGGQGGASAADMAPAVSRIPRDKSTVPAGESASGSELRRNVENTSNAMLGTSIPRAVMGAGAELMAGRRAAAAAAQAIADRTARVAARRTAAGAKEALRRDATFEGGMKRGGAVKKMAKGGMTSGRATGYRGYGIAKKV